MSSSGHPAINKHFTPSKRLPQVHQFYPTSIPASPLAYQQMPAAMVSALYYKQALHTIKETITTAPVLSYFDTRKPTRLSTDASRHGLGFVLQQNTAGTWNLIQAGSQFLTDTESRYAIIKLEMLAVMLGCLQMQTIPNGTTTLHYYY